MPRATLAAAAAVVSRTARAHLIGFTARGTPRLNRAMHGYAKQWPGPRQRTTTCAPIRAPSAESRNRPPPTQSCSWGRAPRPSGGATWRRRPRARPDGVCASSSARARAARRARRLRTSMSMQWWSRLQDTCAGALPTHSRCLACKYTRALCVCVCVRACMCACVRLCALVCTCVKEACG